MTAGPGDQGRLTALLDQRRSELDEGLRALGENPAVPAAIDAVIRALRARNKILSAGNGGSATEAQHFAAELVGRFRRERSPLPAIALTADSAIMTAIGNDYGYAEVFSRQVRALGRPGDLLLAYSTSGNSPNLLAATEAAHDLGMTVIAITGGKPNALAQAADLTVQAAATDTAVIQEIHLVFTHLLCGEAEEALVGES